MKSLAENNEIMINDENLTAKKFGVRSINTSNTTNIDIRS